MIPRAAGRSWSRRILRIALGAGLAVFLFGGAMGGFNTALEKTNSLEFCISCHDMRWNFEEYKKTAHYSNRSGVRAVCSDCHVPKKDWFAEMWRKFEAADDVWGEITGVISTREKFDARRLQMAQAEWARMKESDSIGCRNCHSFESMDLDQQDKAARSKHGRAAMAESRKTCIDCHKGIVHDLPKVPETEDKGRS
jgi:cytochrome c-type protein NapC